ncbi:seryl-tRNA synthetase [Catenulispora sp. GP43]|uniref:aminoacyl--tRNA ligase-related protein n=1 Tax=Catenulispora sp. GP43 TaxID=3156263 RepID=UPI00351827AF
MTSSTAVSAATPLARMADAGWVSPTSVPGLIGYTPKFESVLESLQTALTALDPHGLGGPVQHAPVVPRETIERAQYAESFPHLLGTVHAYASAEQATAPSASQRELTDVVLAPAACYSVYPQIADRTLDLEQHFDVFGYCYRHEATSEYGRFRSFRMREFVIVGGQEPAWEWREAWIERCEGLFARLGLKIAVVAASDPFFGPGDRFMRASQLQQSLKFEFVAPVHARDEGTAIASANCHKDHLGERFAIRFAEMGVAHSSCMAFGLERVVSALIQAHGDDLANWPEPV